MPIGEQYEYLPCGLLPQQRDDLLLHLWVHPSYEESPVTSAAIVFELAILYQIPHVILDDADRKIEVFTYLAKIDTRVDSNVLCYQCPS